MPHKRGPLASSKQHAMVGVGGCPYSVSGAKKAPPSTHCALCSKVMLTSPIENS